MVQVLPGLLRSTPPSALDPRPTLFRSRVGRRGGLLFIALLVAAAVFLPATSAAAHESLVSASPAEGETATGELTEVTLTFSAEPLTGAETANFLEVKAPDGSVVSGPTAVNGAALTVPIEVTVPGSYEVAWRYVSGDGHPITGAYVFQYDGPSAADSAQPTVPPSEIDSTPPPSATENDAQLWGFGATGLVVLILLVLIISWVAYARGTKSSS